MIAPIVTAFWAGLLGLLAFLLALNVVRLRQRRKVGIGDGGHDDLALAVRVFGNFTEYTAFCLLLIALLEMTGNSRWLVHAAGAALFVGRAAHAWGLSQSSGASTGRVAGMSLTWAVLVIVSVLLVWTAGRAVL
ncbi:MAG TPA: MAPEG family protein [Vineibacter sp.]|nr:MAPEG family protein [Vineibacter sp.]